MSIVKKFIKWMIFRIQVLLKVEFCELQHFPFDPMQPLSELAYGTMTHSCNLLDQAEVKYRLTDGTALGLYRQGEFIKHDNDIDVDVFDISQDQIEQLIKLFVVNGYFVGRIAVYKGKTQQVVFYDKDNVIFDIVIWYENSDVYINNSERGYIRTQERRYFKVLTEWPYKGSIYQMPGFLDEWMVMRYGVDWKTPKTYKGDWKDDCYDIAKI